MALKSKKNIENNDFSICSPLNIGSPATLPMAQAEPAKQKMPWETEPGIAKGQSPKFARTWQKHRICLDLAVNVGLPTFVNGFVECNAAYSDWT